MMIWRNLDPKLLAELLIDMADAFARQRRTRAGARQQPSSFRWVPASASQDRRPRPPHPG